MNEDVDVVIWAAKAGANFLQQISGEFPCVPRRKPQAFP